MKIKTRKFQKNGRVSAFDDKYTGEEREWSDVESIEAFDSRVSGALNFYNYYLDRDDYLPIIAEYMKLNGFAKSEIDSIKFTPKTVGQVTTTGKIARMFNVGMPDFRDYKLRVNEGIAQILSAIAVAQAKKKAEAAAVVVPKMNPHEIMVNRVRKSVLCELEVLLDEWCEGEVKVRKFPIATTMRGENIPISAIGEVVSWLNRQRDEMTEALEKTCEQMVEGYSYLSKPALRNRIKACDAMLNEVVLYKSSKRSTRKPRVKKPKAADKQVQNLKYLNESKDHSIQSCDPIRIIGANTFFAFNTKYRRLMVFKAKGRDGFTVKGTSVKDFDETTSFCLTLRKPEELLPILATRTEKQIEKALEDLKTKRKSNNGRINQDTILIRAL